MPFTLPNNDLAFNTTQSVWMEADIAILTAGLNGVGVVSACEVAAQGSPDMTVAIAAGTIRIASGSLIPVTAGNGTITAADATNPRIDLISASNAGVKTVTAGTAAASPKAPDLPAGHVGLAMVYVPANDTTIASNQITDKRVVYGAVQPPVGYIAYAYPFGMRPQETVTNSGSIAANGGSAAMLIVLTAPMLLDSVTIRNLDTSAAHTWGWDLYYQNDPASATCTRAATSTADQNFTPSAASNQTITASGAPVTLQPGAYWLVIQNRHATQAWACGRIVAATMGLNTISVKTTTNPNGATLDMSTGWSHSTYIYGCSLNGRVFGEGSAF